MLRVKYILFALLPLSVIGCRWSWDRESGVADTPLTGWNSAATLTIHNQDTTSLRDISLFMQYRLDIASDTLQLRVITNEPRGHMANDVISMVLDVDTMHHDIIYTERLYRTNVQLRDTGDYTIQICPLLPINGVMSIGARIEPHGQFKSRQR